jgi:hypothetical protein
METQKGNMQTAQGLDWQKHLNDYVVDSMQRSIIFTEGGSQLAPPTERQHPIIYGYFWQIAYLPFMKDLSCNSKVLHIIWRS